MTVFLLNVMEVVMNDSLLVNVSKYAASDKNSPIENFITEAFAWLLDHDKDVFNCVMSLIKEKSHDHRVINYDVLGEVCINTQVNFNGVFPDMLWEDKNQNWKIVFEHKIWSPLHENQLKNYRDYAKTYSDKHNCHYTLVLITARSSQHQQDPDVALCWYDVAEVIIELENTESKTEWMRREFLALLESNNLLGINPINPLALSYYKEIKAVDTQLTNVCTSSLEKKWDLSNNDNVDFELKKQIFARWGRLGFEFLSPRRNVPTFESWEPSIFCGFITSPEDHLIEDLMSKGVPLTSVILSFNRSLHKIIPTNVHFKALVIELIDKLEKSQITNTLSKHWRLSDRTTFSKFNSWHPLIIYCDLDLFYRGKNKVEDQEEYFFSEINEIQKLILSCYSFKALCIELRQL